MIEGSRSESGPKNLWIRWIRIRIRNTGKYDPIVKLRIEEAAQPAPEEPAPAPPTPATGAVPGTTSPPTETAEEQPGGKLGALIDREGRVSYFTISPIGEAHIGAMALVIM